MDLGTLGGASSRACSINEMGQVAGWAQDAGSVKRAVVWNGGPMDLGAPSGYIVSEAVAVNCAGMVACNAEGNPQTIQAYVWDGAWRALGTLAGRSESIAAGIDEAGRIAGSSLTLGSGDARGFIWEAGVLTNLGTLGGETWALGISSGRVVGSSVVSTPSGDATHAFIWDGAMTDLGVLAGHDHSQALAVNADGVAVGMSWTLTTQFFAVNRATMWRSGQVIDLGLVPSLGQTCIAGMTHWPTSTARGVNNRGQVVGDARCITSGAAQAAFLWENGEMRNLGALIPPSSGWTLLSAMDINDAGEITGFGFAPGGELHAFLLTPSCYADCDGNGGLDVFDFLCFQDAFTAHDPYADCDGNTVLDVFDFLCFQDAFVAGCP
jgi:probable HAF family extracellular repeat protein